MHYQIRKEKLDELKEGRTATYIAEITGYSKVYINYAFSGKKYISYLCALNIIRKLGNTSIFISQMIQEHGIKYAVNYFFEELNDYGN